jgi:hypothetical protein
MGLHPAYCDTAPSWSFYLELVKADTASARARASITLFQDYVPCFLALLPGSASAILPLTVFPIRINGRPCACLPLAGCIWSKRTKGHEAGQWDARRDRSTDLGLSTGLYFARRAC